MFIQVQLVACQQLLVVELLDFRNMHNAEVINGEFCCCDNSPKLCSIQLEDLNNCKPKCDTWFNISVSPCQPTTSCSRGTAIRYESGSVQILEYTFVFVVDCSPNSVSVNILRLLGFNSSFYRW